MEYPHSGVENGGAASCSKLEGMAIWIGTSLASAFFASLQRFSCINLTTIDHEDEIEEESNGRPLMFSVENSSTRFRSDDPSFGEKLAPVWAPPYH